MDPSVEAALRKLEAYAGGGGGAAAAAPAPKIDPNTAAVLDKLEGYAARSTPPPPAPPMVPMPAAPAAPPTIATRPDLARLYPRNRIDPATGRVIDPTTGKPFQQGAPHEAPQPGFLGSAAEMAGTVGETLQPLERITTPHLVDPALRVLAVIANPVQQTAAEAAKGYAKGGAAGILPGIAAGKGRILHSIVQPEIARANIGTSLGVKNPWERGLLDFGGNLAIDWATGKFIQAPLVTGLTGAAGKGLAAAGAYDAPIPGIGKSVNQLVNEAGDVQGVHQYFAARAGQMGEIQREAQGFIQRAAQRTSRLQKAGVDVRGVGEGSMQTVNRLDEYVTHYIEAGSGPRAKFGAQQDVLNEAALMGANPTQRGMIRDYIVNTAKDYTTSWNKTGQALEKIGFLKPGTVQKMGASYVPGMYHATSGNPADIETWLQEAAKIGGVDPGAVGMAEHLLANERPGFANAGKARTLTTYQERVQHGGEFQASPLFAKSIKQQTRIAGKGMALEDIAADPSLVSQTYAPGKLQLTGRQYGAARGLYVQPRTKAAIDALVRPEQMDTGVFGPIMKFWRNSVVAGSAPMIVHHTKYTTAIAEGRLAEEGVGTLTPRDLAAAAAERHIYVTGGAASPAVDALSKNTRAFVPQTGLLEEMGGSLRRGLGIGKGAGKSAGLGMEQLANQTRKVIGTVEQTLKIAMTKKLMTKYSPEEAAQIAQEALSGTGPSGKALNIVEKLGILPFATTKIRALPKVAAIAAKRPDILLRYSGINEAQALGTAMGPQVQARQQMEENPQTAIPIPGMKDRYGRQVFLPQSPLTLNPLNDLPRATSIGILGPAGRAVLAAGNARRDAQGNIVPLSEPGELPPWEKAMRQLEYGLPVGGTIGRTFQRLQNAREGTTPGGVGAAKPFGAAVKEPETVGQALLGILLGAQTNVPEAPSETRARVAANVARQQPWQRYAADYQRMVESGVVRVDRSPALDKIRTPGQAAGQMKAAYNRLQALLAGQEGSYALNDRAARIRNQINWFLSLQSRFKELQGRDLQLEDLARVK